MTLKGGTSQACAACKYQRRRCTPTCQLAPYFPADQPEIFQNAHRLFGVSKIVKLLNQLDDPNQKMIAMKSIIYQSNAREKFPVYGCLGIIQQCELQIQLAEEELEGVLSQLAFYRQQHQQQQQQPQNQDITATLSNSISQLQLGMAQNQNVPNNNNNPILPLFNQDDCGFNMDSMWIQQSNTDNNNNNNNNIIIEMVKQRPQNSSQPLIIQQDDATQTAYDEMHTFFDTIDDRQSYIDSKDVCYESSSESSPKETTQTADLVAENELKNAAACFSLTSVMN